MAFPGAPSFCIPNTSDGVFYQDVYSPFSCLAPFLQIYLLDRLVEGRKETVARKPELEEELQRLQVRAGPKRGVRVEDMDAT